MDARHRGRLYRGPRWVYTCQRTDPIHCIEMHDSRPFAKRSSSVNDTAKMSCAIPEGDDPCESNTSFQVFSSFLLLSAQAYLPSPTISLSCAAHVSGLLKPKVALRVMKPVPIRRGVCCVLANLVECRAGFIGIHMPSAAIQCGSAYSHNIPLVPGTGEL
jgi:hypothetical protein